MLPFVLQWERYWGRLAKIPVKVEDERMYVDFGRKSYALNPAMLRAVLNGYGIDMTKPCTVYE